MAETMKFSQLGEISRAQMAGSDYAVGYKANGDNKKWTFENQADFLLNDSEAGQEFQETFVKVQNTEPTDENNKIWIEETPENEVEVPTYDEFKDLSNLVSGVNEAVFNKLSATADQLSTYIPFTFSTFAGKRYIIKNESSAGGMLARIRQTRDGENGTYITNGTQAGQTDVYEAAEDADYIAVMFGPTSTNPAFSIIQEGDVPSKVEEISEDVEDLKSALNVINITPIDGYVTSSGAMNTANPYKHSQEIQLKAGQIITAYVVALSGVAVFAKSISETTYKVIKVGSSGTAAIRYTYVAKHDEQIVVSFNSNSPYVVAVIDNPALSIERQIQRITSGELRDADDAADNRIYMVNTSVIANLPDFITFDVNHLYYLLTLSTGTDESLSYKGQYIIDQETFDFLAYRRYLNGSWGQWSKSTSFLTTSVCKAYADIRTNVLDVNNLPLGIISFVSSQIPDNLPTDVNYGELNFLVTTRVHNGSLTNWDSQYLIVGDAKRTFFRFYFNGSWRNWTDSTYHEASNVIEIGSGKLYTTLKDGMSAAYQMNGAKVIVYPGTYDLTSEFATALQEHTDRGIALGHGMNVTFLPGSFVMCILDGTNSWAYSQFNPFYAGDGDFVLDGLRIISQNTRYCVHDEKQGSGTFKHTYINCHMEQTDTTSNPLYTQCIGGGMGRNGYIDIIGGYYKSFSTNGRPSGGYNSPDDLQQPITFHNGTSSECYGMICIKNVYLADKGYFRFGCYGNALSKTPVQISGCRIGRPTVMMYENNEYNNINFDITSFNNDVANNTAVQMNGYIEGYT